MMNLNGKKFKNKMKLLKKNNLKKVNEKYNFN